MTNNFENNYHFNNGNYSNINMNRINPIFSNNSNNFINERINKSQRDNNINKIDLNIANNNNKDSDEDYSNNYKKKINLNYFDNKNLLEELRAKYLPDYNIKNKNGNNTDGSLTQSDKNNNNEASEESIQAQKIINEDSSHLNPFRKNIESGSFIKKDNNNNKENKSNNSQENKKIINIKNSIDNNENSLKKENNKSDNNINDNIINIENQNKYEEKEKENIGKEKDININMAYSENNKSNKSINNNESIKEKSNNSIRNKYYTEIINSNDLFNGDSIFNPGLKTSSSIRNYYTNAQIRENNIKSKNENNINNKKIKINMNEKDFGSFSLKNINSNNNENEIEQNSKSIIKEEINKYSTFNNNQKNNVFNNINKINDIQYESSKKSANFENKDEFKEFLISENNNLKKEIKTYEELIRPLVNYINDLNRKLDQKEINPRDIRSIVKSDNPSLYINNLERLLINSNKEITEYIEQMKNGINLNKTIKDKSHKKHRDRQHHSQKSYKSKSYINNIKVEKFNKSISDDDQEELIAKNINKFNFGKGNFFYEDRSDKYIYDYYRNRSINCPACIIGNCNSERGFSPIICYHLEDRKNISSNEENEKNNEDDDINKK